MLKYRPDVKILLNQKLNYEFRRLGILNTVRELLAKCNQMYDRCTKQQNERCEIDYYNCILECINTILSYKISLDATKILKSIATEIQRHIIDLGNQPYTINVVLGLPVEIFVVPKSDNKVEVRLTDDIIFTCKKEELFSMIKQYINYVTINLSNSKRLNSTEISIGVEL